MKIFDFLDLLSPRLPSAGSSSPSVIWPEIKNYHTIQYQLWIKSIRFWLNMCLARNQNASSVSLHSYLDLSDLKSECRFRLIIRFMEYEYELHSFSNAPNLRNNFSKLNERFKFIWFFWWLIILYLWFHYLLGAKVSTIIFCEVSLRLSQSIDLNILELSWWSSTLPCTTFTSISSSSRLRLLLHNHH